MTGVSPTRVIGGRYVVLGELGHGRAGTVWRAEDRVIGREVAVEELHLPGGQRPDERRLIRERLLRAARAAARIDHPGLVTAHDVVSDDDVDHLVKELVRAPTLHDRIATDGPLDERAVTALARQLSAALHAVHSAGVVHGDVAPATVVLCPDAQARIADIGVAEAVDPSRAARVPDFLAPELRAGGPATPESDLWALGATLWFALHGSPQFAGSGDTADISRTAPPGPLGDVLAGLLRRAPHERPTALQVAARLDAPPGQATSGGSASGAHRRRWAVTAVVGLLGVVLGLAGGFALAGAGGPRVTTLTYGADADADVLVSTTMDDACLRGGPETGSIGGTDRVNCADAHDLEVFETLDPFGRRDVPYPGREVLTRFAASACSAAFEAVVPVTEGLETVALVPSEVTFASRSAPDAAPLDGRGVYCLLRAADGSVLTGSRVAGKQG